MAPQIPGFNIVWADDFNGSKGSPPDTNDAWNIVEAGPNRGNNEVQTYTNHTNNVCLSGSGAVWLMPTKDGNGNWTSARLEGKHKFSCQAGKKMILQANLRTGSHPTFQQKGVWPAFWALGDSIRSQGVPWPQCGEWDIMENAGGVGFTLASLHYGDNSNNQHSVGGNPGGQEKKDFVVEGFNTFAVQVDRTPSSWEDETLTWMLNGQPWFTARGSDVGDEVLWGNCAHKAFYVILNVAIGTNFPVDQSMKQPDDQTVSGLGSGMQVDYVAFYKSF